MMHVMWTGRIPIYSHYEINHKTLNKPNIKKNPFLMNFNLISSDFMLLHFNFPSLFSNCIYHNYAFINTLTLFEFKMFHSN